ncbi:GAF and ANTAR domain-containing protein [Geodermatophilus maliterrae]|uniref:GAF and ANTAR domain-containing protein n=1 Tax=Geodermatophilus maliterrae TaxID=3162531 RepID=A0ABV3X9X3_9ACTN
MSTEETSPEPLDVTAAFTELGRLSFDDISMEAMLQRVAELAEQVIPGVAEASVSLVVNDRATTAAYTGKLALDLDESQYGRGYGPCLDAAVGEEIREITDARTEPRWPGYTETCVERGSLSSLSVPIPVRETINGAVNLYAIEPDAPDDDARDVARAFASYAAVAVHNMHLYESTRELAQHLDTAMQTRAVIEQAKGILMSQRRCDAAQAFNLLAAASQRSNRKLRDIAQGLVDGVSRDPQSPNQGASCQVVTRS